MINETAMEMTSQLILEMILELTSDPDGCPLTSTENTFKTQSQADPSSYKDR